MSHLRKLRHFRGIVFGPSSFNWRQNIWRSVFIVINGDCKGSMEIHALLSSHCNYFCTVVKPFHQIYDRLMKRCFWPRMISDFVTVYNNYSYNVSYNDGYYDLPMHWSAQIWEWSLSACRKLHIGHNLRICCSGILPELHCTWCLPVLPSIVEKKTSLTILGSFCQTASDEILNFSIIHKWRYSHTRAPKGKDKT